MSRKEIKRQLKFVESELSRLVTLSDVLGFVTIGEFNRIAELKAVRQQLITYYKTGRL